MRKYIKVFALVLVAVTLVTILASCGKESKFIGTWYEVDEDGERTGDRLVFAGDGTGSVTEDGMNGSVTWSVDGKVLSMSVSICGMSESYICSYKFSGKTLTLTVDSEDEVWVYEKD